MSILRHPCSLCILLCAFLAPSHLPGQENNRSLITATKTEPTGATISRINAAGAHTFDASPLGIRELKAGGVDDEVIISILQKNKDSLTNPLIVVLSNANVGASEIVRLIREAATEQLEFDATPTALGALSTAGVDSAITQAIQLRMGGLVDADEDLPVLATLGVRFSGGAVFGTAPPEITRAEGADGMPTATITTPQFSQAASYLAFESQPYWLLGKRDDADLQNWLFSPLVNVRLTTIAVAETSEITPPDGDFLKSQKAVQFQFGTLFQRLGNEFSLGSQGFRWGLGPIARYMPQSITDSERATRIWNINDDLYEAFTVGGRLALYQKGKFGQRTRWRPAAYIDVSRGWFENFETATAIPDLATTPRANECLAAPNACLASGDIPARSAYDTHQEGRWYIESRMMLKYVYLGFDINTGRGKDDIRFIGGLTVSLDRFLKPPSN